MYSNYVLLHMFTATTPLTTSKRQKFDNNENYSSKQKCYFTVTQRFNISDKVSDKV